MKKFAENTHVYLDKRGHLRFEMQMGLMEEGGAGCKWGGWKGGGGAG